MLSKIKFGFFIRTRHVVSHSFNWLNFAWYYTFYWIGLAWSAILRLKHGIFKTTETKFKQTLEIKLWNHGLTIQMFKVCFLTSSELASNHDIYRLYSANQMKTVSIVDWKTLNCTEHENAWQLKVWAFTWNAYLLFIYYIAFCIFVYS